MSDGAPSFSLLHLSDLHFKGGARSAELEPKTLAERMSERLLGEKRSISMVVISGDFTLKGASEGFEDAVVFATTLTEKLNLGLKDVLIVPGNHDLRRSRKGDSDYRPDAFLSYASLHHRISGKVEPLRQCWYTTHWSNGSVFVLGLNSCEVESAANNGIGKVDPKQMEQAARDWKDTWSNASLRIAVIHHHLKPVSWCDPIPQADKKPSVTLNSEEIIQWLLEHDFQIVLHGHQHQPFVSGERRYFGNEFSHKELLVIGGGSIGAGKDELGQIGRRSFNVVTYSTGLVNIETTTFWERDFKSEQKTSLVIRPNKGTLGKFFDRLETKQVSLVRSSYFSAGSDVSLIRVSMRDLASLAPVIYEFAGDGILATSFTPLDFWLTFSGKLILESARERSKTSTIRRLFVGGFVDRKTLEVMEDNNQVGVHTAFLRTEEYATIALPVVGKVYEQIRSLIRCDYPQMPDFDAFIDGDPSRLALALYRDNDQTSFIGFDFVLGTEAIVGLLMDAELSLVEELKESLERAWKKGEEEWQNKESVVTKRIYLFGAHRWNREGVIRECLSADYKVTLCLTEADHSVLDATLAHMAHEVLRVDKETLSRLGSPSGNRWALGLDDYVCEATAELGAVLGQSPFPRKSARDTLDKSELRDLWNKFAHNKEPFHKVLSKVFNGEQGIPSEELDSLFLSYPNWIFKPNCMSASIEIHPVSNTQKAQEAILCIRKALTGGVKDYAATYGIELDTRIIAEAEIPRAFHLHPRAEYSTEWVSSGGRHVCLGITQKFTSDRYIESGHLFPAPSFPETLKAPLEEAISHLLQELEVQYGLSHWEFIVTPEDKIALVEGHLRPGGDRITDLVELASGLNPFRTLLDALPAKASRAWHPKSSKTAGIFFLKPVSPVESVKEVVYARKARVWDTLFVNERALKSLASPWKSIDTFADRHAYVIASGENLKEIRAKCEEGARSITIKCETADGQLRNVGLRLVEGFD